VYRFNQTLGDEYTIFEFDTSVTIDNITLPLRLEVIGEILEDDSISTPVGGFMCKKFVRTIEVSLVLTPIVVELFSLEDYIWIAEEYWIVQGLIPPINIDLSGLNMNLPSFYIPGLITKLNSTNIPTSVEDELAIPEEIILSQNYPNPFNPSTTIKFSLPSSGYAALRIYNALGEEVAVLLNKELTTGNYEVEWNASNVPSGVYFYHLQTEGFVETKKMLLLK